MQQFEEEDHGLNVIDAWRIAHDGFRIEGKRKKGNGRKRHGRKGNGKNSKAILCYALVYCIILASKHNVLMYLR